MKCLTYFMENPLWRGGETVRSGRRISSTGGLLQCDCRGYRLHCRFYAASSHDTMQKFSSWSPPPVRDDHGFSFINLWLGCSVA